VFDLGFGSFQEPDEFPGLAHFLEHIKLFLSNSNVLEKMRNNKWSKNPLNEKTESFDAVWRQYNLSRVGVLSKLRKTRF
jgi:secreted Zn-dependent insulinase-like peptidase